MELFTPLAKASNVQKVIIFAVYVEETYLQSWGETCCIVNSDGHLFQLCSLKWNALTMFFILKSQNAKDKHQNKDWDNLSYKDSHILGVIYKLSAKCLQFSTMAQWSCCRTLTFRILHFEVLTFWNVKFFWLVLSMN